MDQCMENLDKRHDDNIPPDPGRQGEDADVPEEGICSGSQDNGNREISKLYRNAPCLVCGQNCVIKSETSTVSHERDSDSSLTEDEVFYHLCHFLKIKMGACWNSDKERIPICQNCKNQVHVLVDLQTRLRELQQDLEEGVSTFRKLCKEAEGTFEELGIYEKDIRYFRLRNQLKVGRPNKRKIKLKSVVNNENLNSQDPQLRRSARKPSDLPVVRIFVADKSKADEVQQIKSEILVMSDNEDDGAWDRDGNIPVKMEVIDSNEGDMESIQEKRRPSKASPRVNSLRQSPKKKCQNRKVDSNSKRTGKRYALSKRRRKYTTGHPDTEDDNIQTFAQHQPRNRKQKKLDADYEPNDDDNVSTDGEDENDRCRLDASTGFYCISNITFKPTLEDSGRFECVGCNEIIAKSTFRRHFFKRHSTRYQCKECGKCEGAPCDLAKHIHDCHSIEKPVLECPICGKPCSTIKNRLKSHMSTHYSEKEKEEALARGEDLKLWSSRKNTQCDHCGKKFTGRTQLERHKLCKHPKPEEADLAVKLLKELCPDCGKLVDKHYMKKHRAHYHNLIIDSNLEIGTKLMKEPESTKRFMCSICDKRFFNSTSLIKHKRSVHEKDHQFQCSLCAKTFLLKRYLDRHMNTHNNIRPFPCQHCPMAFFSKGNLTRHCGIYHSLGANPKRKSFIRGMQTKERVEFDPADLESNADPMNDKQK